MLSANRIGFLVATLCSFLDICSSLAVLQPRAATASPISIAPSQSWDGNDGPWSSFAVHVGTPPQSLKVLIGTSSTQTWAVATEGCGSGDPTSCGEDRGGVWNRNNSLTYIRNTANASTDIYAIGLEENLGYTGKARFGFDTIQLGGGPILTNQTVAGIATQDFFMGVFGLTPRSSNFTDEKNPVPSFLENLRKDSKIPSLSWGYTAGNQYRLNNVFGSLTLGGYDASKFIPNSLTFPFDDTEGEQDLGITIQKISPSTSTTPFLETSIKAFLDSTIPYIYLPLLTCALFEKEFSLTWNSTFELYLIDETKHSLLQAQNPNITFTLGTTSTETVDITFPYSAFALTASYPLTPTPTKYFPLKRATNETKFVLGRAFFQEAYITADYDRRNFSISQCAWNALAIPDLIPIYAPGSEPNTATLSTAAIAGIAAGGSLLLIALLLLYIFWFKPRRAKRKISELDSSQLYERVHGQGEAVSKAELDASYGAYPTATPIDSKTAAVEMPISDPVYEMAAREEVAIEMCNMHSPIEEEEDDSSERGNQRWSGSRNGRSASQRERNRGRMRDRFGFPILPGEESGVSSVSSSFRDRDRDRGSRRGTPVVSPATAGEEGGGRRF